MLKKDFNSGWRFAKGGGSSLMSIMQQQEDTSIEVQLPHDAMILEETIEETKNKGQTGFYPGGEYTYTRILEVPEEWKNKTVFLEFEGVMNTASVFVDGILVETNLYPYSNFYVELNGYLKYGDKSEIKVVANTSYELTSRWYSGSGIYRPVSLYVGGGVNISLDSLKVHASDVNSELAIINTQVQVNTIERTKRQIRVNFEFSHSDEIVAVDTALITIFPGEDQVVYSSIALQNPKLWNTYQPNLYQVRVTLNEGETILDESIDTFGIRSLTVDAVRGMLINGEEVKLRGACIHHDNGILGAATYDAAEEKRVAELKNAGFNSIRMAHHPASKSLLRACDRLGVVVMDELSDMWISHKNGNDYAFYFKDHWQEETIKMVLKDYNRPSVVLYSTGNEIPDLGDDRGIALGMKINELIKNMDSTRFTTNAFNGLLAAKNRMGEIVQDLLAKQGIDPEAMRAQAAQSAQAADESNGESSETQDNAAGAGANGLNMLMGLIFGKNTNSFDTHPILNEIVDAGAMTVDVVGFNYLTGRHELEKQLHPNKTVIGSETFPSDITRLWKIVKENKHVLGDYTWTGYDYLGEAGIGIFYYDGSINFMAKYPDRVAYIGDIDITGYRRPISYYREIVFGLRKDPYIGVMRLNRHGQKSSSTPWMFKDNIASWTWPGYEGKPAVVDVYGQGDEVELILNGKTLGKKAISEGSEFTATYELTYEAGELLAVNYEKGVEIGRFSLRTAEGETVLDVKTSSQKIKADPSELLYVEVQLTDKAGTYNMFDNKEVSIEVSGNGVLLGYGSADPQAKNKYQDTKWSTYDGRLLAAIRSTGDAGSINVKLTMDSAEKTITIDAE